MILDNDTQGGDWLLRNSGAPDIAGVSLFDLRMLELQTRVAEYTYILAVAAVASVLLTSVGLFLIFLTLRETRKASHYAGEAVLVTRSIGNAQIRAYLTIKDVSVLFASNGYVFDFFMVNSGASPARKCEVGVELVINGVDGGEIFRGNVRQYLGSIASGDNPVRLLLNTEMPEFYRDTTYNGSVFVKVNVDTAFTDVFGIEIVESGRSFSKEGGGLDLIGAGWRHKLAPYHGSAS